MKRVSEYRYILILSIFFGIVGAFLRANNYVAEHNTYIEVCNNGIANVPLDTKFVKCNGIVRKVLGFEKNVAGEEDPCKCPQCCDGKCYVIVTSDPPPEPSADFAEISFCPDPKYPREYKIRETYILWLSC